MMGFQTDTDCCEIAEQLVADVWNAQASWWIGHVRTSPEGDALRHACLNPAIFAALGDLRGCTLLDAGCGEGYLARLLAVRGASVTGLDSSAPLIAAAQETERAAPLGINYVRGCLNHPPRNIAAIAWDNIVCNMVLMDVPDLEGSMRSLGKMLASGGRLVASILVADLEPEALRNKAAITHPAADRLIAQFGASPAWLGDDAPFATVYFPRPWQSYLDAAAAAGIIITSCHQIELPPALSSVRRMTGIAAEHPLVVWTARRKETD